MMRVKAFCALLVYVSLQASWVTAGERRGVTVQGPFVTAVSTPVVVSIDLSRLPRFEKPESATGPHIVPRHRAEIPVSTVKKSFVDPLLQRQRTQASAPTPHLSFAGIGATGALPPDTVGDVGPNHYIQMVNSVFAIYDKSGTLLAGPSDINNLWSGSGLGPCESNADGDPIVLYDPLADRWLISQFADSTTDYECIAISQGANPVSGGWYLYAFATPEFPDYPKLAVWPDAYYMGTNEELAAAAYAFDRDAMLAGNPATSLHFTVAAVGIHSMIVPGDLDGSLPPPAGAPAVFYRFVDDGSGGADRLELFELHADFDTPANASFTGPQILGTAAFAPLCNYSVACIAQQGTSHRLDSITEWPMWRLQYRNLGTHESLVGNHSVNVGGDQAGVRWFELRRSGAAAWSIYQQGTYAPDEHSRWMGSIAMDGAGNIGLGYSVSSSTLYPSIRVTGRLAADALGTMRDESSLTEGSGSQTAWNRWGDYSSLNVDPSDDCTFWYTNEYYAISSVDGWSTTIGAFRFPSCTAAVVFTDGFEGGNTAAWSATVP